MRSNGQLHSAHGKESVGWMPGHECTPRGSHHAILWKNANAGIVKLIIASDDVVPFFIQSIQSFLQFSSCQTRYTFSQDAENSLARLKNQLHTVERYSDITDGSIERCSIILPVKNLTRARQPSFLDRLTPSVIEGVNSGAFKLVFDFSNEAASSIAIKRYLVLLRQKGITNLNALHWICGNHLIPDRVHGIHHHVFNYFEIQVYVDLISGLNVPLDSEIVTERYSTRNKSLAHVLCLNATPRHERLAAMLCLFKEGVVNTSDYTANIPNLPFLSFGGFRQMKNGGVTPDQIRDWLLAHDMPDLIPYLDWITDKKLIVDNFKNKGNGLFNKVDISIYSQTCLSYVTETTMTPEISRFTEKSLKPLLLGHPLIVAGTSGNIQLLRQLGFSLLDHIIDHSYDRESDVPTRIRMSAREVKSFLDRSSMSDSTLQEEIIPHLNGNIHWGLTGYPLGLYRRAMEILSTISN
jgi:hypothetical protein